MTRSTPVKAILCRQRSFAMHKRQPVDGTVIVETRHVKRAF